MLAVALDLLKWHVNFLLESRVHPSLYLVLRLYLLIEHAESHIFQEGQSVHLSIETSLLVHDVD